MLTYLGIKNILLKLEKGILDILEIMRFSEL